VKQIEFRFLIAKADNAGATDPYVTASIVTASTDIVFSTTDEVHYSAIDAGAGDTPDEYTMGMCRATTPEDTAMYWRLNVYDFCRPISLCAFELGDYPVNDAVTGAVDPHAEVQTPIFDDKSDALLVGSSELLRSNRTALFSWSDQSGTGETIVGNTYTNIIDGVSGAPGAATPGFILETNYHNTYSRTVVPVLLAVYAERTVGVNPGLVRIYDGTNSVEVTGIAAAGWYTQAGTIPAQSATKYDLQAKHQDAAPSAIRVDAACLYEYE
jgi:hypothetical protein